MFKLKLVPVGTNIDFIGKRVAAYVFSAVLLVASVALFLTRDLNYGIDFRGGIMVEIGLEQAPDLDSLRAGTNDLGLGDVSIQAIDPPLALDDDEGDERAFVIIRVEQQPGGDEAQNVALAELKTMLRGMYGTPVTVPESANLLTMTPEEIAELAGTEAHDAEGNKLFAGISFRRQEIVGPKVSGELIQTGTLAILFAVGAVLIYIWLRFEWQFGVGAVVALVHDVLLTVGFFSLTQLEFTLSIIAALLTIVGYSLNDTVVVYDRVRENLRKYRKVPLPELFNTSINETLSRTVMTSLTTLLALGSLYFFGGEVIRGFTAAMIWGVFIGTYSSIFIAVPFLLLLNLNREHMVPQEA